MASLRVWRTIEVPVCYLESLLEYILTFFPASWSQVDLMVIVSLPLLCPNQGVSPRWWVNFRCKVCRLLLRKWCRLYFSLSRLTNQALHGNSNSTTKVLWDWPEIEVLQITIIKYGDWMGFLFILVMIIEKCVTEEKLATPWRYLFRTESLQPPSIHRLYNDLLSRTVDRSLCPPDHPVKVLNKY